MNLIAIDNTISKVGPIQCDLKVYENNFLTFSAEINDQTNVTDYKLIT